MGEHDLCVFFLFLAVILMRTPVFHSKFAPWVPVRRDGHVGCQARFGRIVGSISTVMMVFDMYCTHLYWGMLVLDETGSLSCHFQC